MAISARSGQSAVADAERSRRREPVRPSADDDPAAPVVFVVDDDSAIRDSLRRLISSVGFKVEVFPSARAFLGARRPDVPGCLVLDVRLPGLSGLDLQRELAATDAELPIIFLTGHGEVRDSVRAIQRGAIDFLIKPVEGTVLIDAVTRALAQDTANRAARMHLQGVRERYERLTDREREVFAHLISGQLNKQVAADLGISERTIKLHRARIFQKLQTDSIAALTRIAMDLGVEPVRAP